MSDSEFQLRLPNRKHATNLPSPTHCHSGTTDVMLCNLKSPSASSLKCLHYTKCDHAPKVHGQDQIVVLDRKCLKQRRKCNNAGVSENLNRCHQKSGAPTRTPHAVVVPGSLTVNPSVSPNDLRKSADNITERENAMLPSPVFGFEGDHRFRPSRLPSTDACQENPINSWVGGTTGLFHVVSTRGRGATLTRASPTPSTRRPVKWSNCDGLRVQVRQRISPTGAQSAFGGLTPQTTRSWHTP
jgi:hypothetical protein